MPDRSSHPSVWTRPQPRRRAPLALDRDRIVAAAVRLLDAEGIEALSMRRLGQQLGAGATSLYTYVATKEELVELVVDEVYAEIERPQPGAGEDWRAATTRCARSLRACFLAHPWLVSVLGQVGLSYLGPHFMALTESLLTVLEDAGFELARADLAVHTLVAYVVGVSASEAAWIRRVARTGLSEQEWTERLWPAAQQAVSTYPRLSRLYADQPGATETRDRDRAFESGLTAVLDGLEAGAGLRR